MEGLSEWEWFGCVAEQCVCVLGAVWGWAGLQGKCLLFCPQSQPYLALSKDILGTTLFLHRCPKFFTHCSVFQFCDDRSIMLHQSGVIVYKNNYSWLNLVYVCFVSCFVGFEK